MTTVLQLTAYAFGKNGPAAMLAGSYRPPQEIFALRVAETLDACVVNPPRPDLYLTQVDPGVGKTIAYLVPHIFDFILRGRSVIISTFSIQLRKQIIEEDRQLAMDIVDDTLAAFGIPLQPVTFGERKSLRSYASLIKAAMMLDETNSHVLDSADVVLRKIFYEEVDSHFARGELFELSEWYAQYGDSIPDTWPKDLSLTVSETNSRQHSNLDPAIVARISPAISQFRAGQGGDVTVCTHAMFLLNNLTFGGILGTNGGRAISGVIDECDAMLNVALQWSDTRAHPLRLLGIVKPLGRGKSVREVCRKIKDFLAWIPNQALYKFENFEDVGTNPGQASARDKCADLLTSLSSVHHLIDKQPIAIIEEFDGICDTLAQIVFFMDMRGGASEAARQTEKSLTKIICGTQDGRRFIGLQPGKEDMAQDAWRNYNKHSFEKIHLTSGTIVPSYNGKFPFSDMAASFKRRIGIGKYDSLQNSVHIPCMTHGKISKLVFADPGLPFTHTNRATYAAYVAKLIELADNEPGDMRTLVLFPSDDLKKQVHALLPPHLAIRCIVKEVGVYANAYFPKLIKDPRAIWLGHDWFGVNFVHNGLTLFERVIIAQLPVSPANAVKTSNNPSSIVDLKTDAEAKIRQGLGRAIRSSGDSPELWFADPRMEFRHLLKTMNHQWIASNGNRFAQSSDCIPSHLYSGAQTKMIFEQNGVLVLK